MVDTAIIKTLLTADNTDLKGKITEAERSASGMKETFSQIGQAIVGGFSANAIIQFGREALATADLVSNLSNRLKISSESVQSLGVLAKEAGLDMGTFESAIMRVTRAQADATNGSKAQIKAFADLGISIEEVKSLNAEQLFERVAVALNENKGSAQATSAAYDLLGRGAGTALGVIQQLGSEGFEALNQRMKDAGQILSDEVITNLDRVDDALERTTRAAKNFGIEILGNWGQIWERAGEWWDNLGRSDETLKQIAETERWRAERNQKIVEEQEQQKVLAQEQSDLDAARTRLAQIMAENRAATLTSEEKLKQTVTQIEEIEAKISRSYEDQSLTALERTNLEIESEMLGRQRKKLEEDIAKDALPEQNRLKQEQLRAEQEMLREIEERERAILTKEEQLARLREENRVAGLTVEERLAELTSRRLELQTQIQNAMTSGVADAEQLLDAQIELEEVNREIARHMDSQSRLGEELKNVWQDLTTEQADSLIALRDALADMSDEEIDRFISSLQQLATGLSGLQWPDLTPLRVIGQFDIAPGISSRVRPLGEALRALSGDLRGIVWPDLSPLETIGRFDIASGISMRARPFGEAIRALAIDLDQAMRIMPRDLTALNIIAAFRLPNIDPDQVEAFAEAMSDIAQALQQAAMNVETVRALAALFEAAESLGSVSLTITVEAPPGGIPESIPITLPDSPIDLSASGIATEATLAAIAAKIEAMEGVIWR